MLNTKSKIYSMRWQTVSQQLFSASKIIFAYSALILFCIFALKTTIQTAPGDVTSTFEIDEKLRLFLQQFSTLGNNSNAKYSNTVDSLFTQTKKLTASDAAPGDLFGNSVSISGDTAIVGANFNSHAGLRSGAAYIFQRNQGGANNWEQVKKLTASDATAEDQFGVSVAIYQDTVVIGAWLDSDAGSGSGAAYIFERNQGGANNWGQVKKIIASDATSDVRFGKGVGIYEDTVVIGAYRDDSSGANSGSAYIFQRNQGGANNWGQVRKLTASDGSENSFFGWSVSVFDNTVIVGAYQHSNIGAAYIFERNQGGTNNWGQVKKLTASDPTTGVIFGEAVSVSGNTIVIGAYTIVYDNQPIPTDSGAAYVFERNQGGINNWGQVKKLIASDAAGGDEFGRVKIDGDTIIVGAHRDDDGGTDSGSAYLFQRNHGGTNNWGQVQKLTATDAGAGNRFGSSVDISGNTIIAGAYQDDDYGIRSGSAYIFMDNNTMPFDFPFDFDGDSKTDISIFRPAPGEWWYLRSSDGSNRAFQFGQSTDKLVPADFTGDGKTDIAFWRPSDGNWFVLRSEDSSFFAFPFGASGDTPVPADYDGDGKADAAVFRASSATWFIQKSTGGTDIIPFGASNDKPVVADYDGDGKADIAIFRPNGANGAEWWIRRSSNQSVFALQFGNSTDKPTQGDFTGDGKADIALWRPSNGNWFVLRSEDFSFFAFPFGANGDIPVAGDYDGDGKFDAGVFRPSSSTWFIQRSTAGTLIQQFGANGDFPVPSVFVP